jgi:hypothetical protein
LSLAASDFVQPKPKPSEQRINPCYSPARTLEKMKLVLIATIILAALVNVVPRSEARNQPFPRGPVHTETKIETPHWYQTPEWILVIVTSITAFFIGWQSLETRRAAETARDNIALIIAKECARIRVEPTGVEIPKQGVSLSIADSPKARIINYKIFCYGTTPAFIVDSSSRVTITASNEPPAVRNYTMPIPELPSVMPTSSEGLQRVNFAFDRPRPNVSPDQIAEEIANGKMFLHFWGFISYRMVFDNEIHWTKFRYTYGIEDTVLVGFGLSDTTWSKAGPEEDNQET